jgi:hypothetical protein
MDAFLGYAYSTNYFVRVCSNFHSCDIFLPIIICLPRPSVLVDGNMIYLLLELRIQLIIRSQIDQANISVVGAA